MPSIFKSLLGGSAKSQSSKKLKKGTSSSNQKPPLFQPTYDRHSNDRDSVYSDDMYARGKHSEFPERRSLHGHQPHLQHATSTHSGRYPDIPFSPTHDMPRYELYDRAGPGPLPLSPHQSPSHEFYEPYPSTLYSVPQAQASVYHYPNYHPPRSHHDTSWEPIPDVRRESTIVDPDAYSPHEMHGYTSEEERWMRAHEEYPPSEGYGRFVTPGKARSDQRSVRREEIVPHFGGEGDWEWPDNCSTNGPPLRHARGRSTPHPGQKPGSVNSRQGSMNGQRSPYQLSPAPSLHREKSLVDIQSRRHSTASNGSKFQEHINSPQQTYATTSHTAPSHTAPSHAPVPGHIDHQSLKERLSNMFSKSAEGRGLLDPNAMHRIGGQSRAPSRAPSRISVAETKKSARISQVHRDGDHHSEVSLDSMEEDWREGADVYQYIVPAGVNVIFKDKHGNEITRVGDYPDSAKSKRKSRRSAPIVIIDQNGKVLYDEASTRKPPQRLPSPATSAGSSASLPSAKTILISPKGEQIHLGGSTTSQSSGSQTGRDARHHRR